MRHEKTKTRRAVYSTTTSGNVVSNAPVTPRATMTGIDDIARETAVQNRPSNRQQRSHQALVYLTICRRSWQRSCAFTVELGLFARYPKDGCHVVFDFVHETSTSNTTHAGVWKVARSEQGDAKSVSPLDLFSSICWLRQRHRAFLNILSLMNGQHLHN